MSPRWAFSISHALLSKPAASVPSNRARNMPFPPPWRNYLKTSPEADTKVSILVQRLQGELARASHAPRNDTGRWEAAGTQQQGPSPSSHIEPAAPQYLSIQGAFLFLLPAAQAPSLLLLSVRSTGLITYMHKRQIKKQRNLLNTKNIASFSLST